MRATWPRQCLWTRKTAATSTVDVPSDISTDTELDITAQIHNADGELVARAGVRWKLSPPKD